MKTWLCFLFCFAFAVSAMSQEMEFEWIKKVSNAKGKITMLSEDTWIIIPNDNPNGRYFSRELPREYRKEGMMVTFCGMVGKIPPNVRMLATPFKLSVIKISKAEAQKFGLEKRKFKFK